jgi:hypothetical protein
MSFGRSEHVYFSQVCAKLCSLDIKTDESLLLVRELGFANLALGLSGLFSLAFPAWRVPALAGGVFYGLAGGNHFLHPSATGSRTLRWLPTSLLLLCCLPSARLRSFASSRATLTCTADGGSSSTLGFLMPFPSDTSRGIYVPMV